MSIRTDRLELIPASLELVDLAMQGDAALAGALGVQLPASWPPEFYENTSLEFTRDRLLLGPEQAGWLMYFFILREPRTIIGYGGYKGVPSETGTIEVGYSVVDEFQRRGYATEVTQGLIDRARTFPGVRRVVAETMADRPASIRVLEKVGFRFVGMSESEEGVIVYELLLEAGAEVTG